MEIGKFKVKQYLWLSYDFHAKHHGVPSMAENGLGHGVGRQTFEPI